MRWIKKYNEEVKFDYEWDPECVRLQNIINSYNDQLLDDEVWKNFYHRIPLYYQKQLDSDFLENIIEFGKKRLEDIRKENEEDLKSLKEILINLEDQFPELIEKVDITKKDGLFLNIIVHYHLSKELLGKRKKDKEFYFDSFEVMNLWPNIISIISQIEDSGYNVSINYAPNLVQIVLIINKYIEK